MCIKKEIKKHHYYLTDIYTGVIIHVENSDFFLLLLLFLLLFYFLVWLFGTVNTKYFFEIESQILEHTLSHKTFVWIFLTGT